MNKYEREEYTLEQQLEDAEQDYLDVVSKLEELTARINKIAWIVSDDWEAFYVNGKLVQQYHNIDPWVITKAAGIAYHVLTTAGKKWLVDEGEFPENLDDIPIKALLE